MNGNSHSTALIPRRSLYSNSRLAKDTFGSIQCGLGPQYRRIAASISDQAHFGNSNSEGRAAYSAPATFLSGDRECGGTNDPTARNTTRFLSSGCSANVAKAVSGNDAAGFSE